MQCGHAHTGGALIFGGVADCGSGGRAGFPLITEFAVRCLAPPVHVLKCPWERHLAKTMPYMVVFCIAEML